MRSVREETSTAMLGVIEDLSEELAKALDRQAAAVQIRGEYERGQVAALEGTADLLRGRARRAAQRIGELESTAPDIVVTNPEPVAAETSRAAAVASRLRGTV